MFFSAVNIKPSAIDCQELPEGFKFKTGQEIKEDKSLEHFWMFSFNQFAEMSVMLKKKKKKYLKQDSLNFINNLLSAFTGEKH